MRISSLSLLVFLLAHPLQAQSYRSYTAAMCITAADRAAWFSTIRADSASGRDIAQGESPDHAVATRTLQDCMRGRTPASTPAAELVDFARAAARLGDDTLVTRAMEQALRTLPRTGDKARALRRAVGWYSGEDGNYRESDTTHALFYLRQIDALPDSVALEKSRAYHAAAQYAYHVVHDFPLARHLAEQSLAVFRTLSSADQRLYVETGVSVSYILGNSVAKVDSVPAGVAVFDSAIKEFSYAVLPRIGALRAARHALIAPSEPVRIPPPIMAHRWINASYDSLARPIPTGKVTVLVFVAPFGHGPLLMPAIPQLLQGFSEQSVNVWLVTTLRGFWHWKPNVTLDEEADGIAAYYRDRYKITVPIALYRPEFQRQPDGRMGAAPSPNPRAYQVSDLPWFVIIGPKGQMAYTSSWSPSAISNARLTIQQLLGQ